MSRTVGYISNQIHIFSFLAPQQTVHRLNYNLDDINVLPFIETADVVSFGNLAVVENHINGAGMIFYIQPVTYIFAFTIYRQRFAVTDVVDEQRDQFFRELVRTVVVGTVGYNGRMP